MPIPRPLFQVDVFTAEPLRGNPVAVVHDAAGLDAPTMQRFAAWMNLSETTFLLPPTRPEADYAVRIFTPERELPFAGHPTLGTAHAWLAAGGTPRAETLVQECGVGLVAVRRGDDGALSFAAPPRSRTGPLDEADLAPLVRGLGLDRAEVASHEWCDNGPPWRGLLLRSADRVLELRPDADALAGLFVGVAALHGPGAETQLEVRAFFPVGDRLAEDPVTGSFNAALGQWLTEAGVLPARYVAAQGTVLGRAGRVVVERNGDEVWVGGGCVTAIEGTVRL
jgi:PhzF family phenazine biosynthesis protein